MTSNGLELSDKMCFWFFGSFAKIVKKGLAHVLITYSFIPICPLLHLPCLVFCIWSLRYVIAPPKRNILCACPKPYSLFVTPILP